MSMIETQKVAQRAVLVAVQHGSQDAFQTAELLEELDELTQTYGAVVVNRVTIRLDQPHPRFFIGSGNAEMVNQVCRQDQANLLVFDDNLSPGQQRNWEKLCGIPVYDRRELILKIFAQRASTREAVLQIQLALSEYMLPRLKRAWTHLERQQGGLGIRGGAGEKQIEMDARMIRTRISRCKAELTLVRQRRAEQRKQRKSVPVPTAAIVGYTNAGKSSLLNKLTQAAVLVEDKLFATLDPTTRRLKLPNQQLMLLTDTVGFVRKLPHDLVEAFKATLEEATVADFLLQVADASSRSLPDHIATTRLVMGEVGAADKEMLLVLNKIDLVTDPLERRRLRKEYPEAIQVSVHTGEGLDLLQDRLVGLLRRDLTELHLKLPQSAGHLLAQLHRQGQVSEERYTDDAIFVTATVPPSCREQFTPYLCLT